MTTKAFGWYFEKYRPQYEIMYDHYPFQWYSEKNRNVRYYGECVEQIVTAAIVQEVAFCKGFLTTSIPDYVYGREVVSVV